MVAVAMSGGVDSSVAAARVARRGLRAMGITLSLWPRDRDVIRDRGCCSIDAVEDARRVAAALGMPHYVWNLEQEFESAVVREFEDEYASGRTPNPCVRCNQRVKFGLLLERARAVGATHLATGHYARIGRRGGDFTLHSAVDERRDQAYVLHRLNQHQLAAAVFPLGAAASKQAVRAEASELGLGTAAKLESQDLCFVDAGMRDDLNRRLRGRFSSGPVVDASGARVGTHQGLPFFTVGQRSGLDLRTDRPDAKPMYVIELQAAENAVVVGPREALRRRSLAAGEFTWIGGVAAPAETGCQARLRAHGRAVDAVVAAAHEDSVHLRFLDPVDQVAPGQAVVLYRGDEVIGGGVIRSAA